MTTKLPDILHDTLSLSWLTGPIFDKELRVSSRRRRNYVLRFIYLFLLLTIIGLIWLEETRYGRGGIMQVSRMAKAGKIIIISTVWFQFCATQLIAVIMLSTSISDEIYNKTLGTLMTTPITSFQIVLGKLLSKLLQLLLYIAISLPLLAVVRVFGGVPWGYIISSLCITLTAILFVGSLSLFFSILSKRAYVVIIFTLLSLGAIFFLIPLGIGYTCDEIFDMREKEFLPALCIWNPYGMLAVETEIMMSAFRPVWMTLSVPLHCAIMLGATAGLLALSMKMVRKVALSQAIGQLSTTKRNKRKALRQTDSDADSYIGRIRRIKGSPIIWKERQSKLFGRHKFAGIIITLLAISILVISYVALDAENDLDDDDVHVCFALILGGLGLMFTIIMPATCITTEKESQNWLLLMATPLSDWEILAAKCIGMLRRTLPIWLFLFGHVILFSIIGYIHWIAIIHLLMIVTWLVVFLCGSGLYFSTVFKRSTAAVVANFALPLVLWAVMPMLLGIVVVAVHVDDIIEKPVEINPAVQIIVTMMGATEQRDHRVYKSGNGTYWDSHASDFTHFSYNWPNKHKSYSYTTWVFFWTMITHIFFGYLFAWRGKCRFRKKIF